MDMKLTLWCMTGILFATLLFSPCPSNATRGYIERNKMTDEEIKTEGFLPVLFNPYTISADDPQWDEKVSIVMSQHSALLVEINPLNMPTGVILFASSRGSRRAMKAVWANDHVTEPIRLWTNRYWISDKTCDPTGCPRLMFKATKGTLAVTILEKRP